MTNPYIQKRIKTGERMGKMNIKYIKDKSLKYKI
jgi:hypothetical protein